MNKSRIISISGMLVVLVIAYGFDRAWDALGRYRASTFRVAETLWLNVLIELAFAAAIVFLTWLMLVRYQKDTLTGWVFVIVGLLVLWLATPYGYLLRAFMGPPRTSPLSRFSISLMGFGFLFQAGAFLAALGAAGLFRRSQG